jgi:uncharacterized membrane protein
MSDSDVRDGDVKEDVQEGEAEALQKAKKKKEDILKLPAKSPVVEFLYEKKLLSDAARDEALKFIHPLDWWYWTNRFLLFFGAALVLAGIVFFFAFNWEVMTPLLKFTLIEVGILACVLGAFKTGLDKITGKMLLMSAAVLVGVFLAVFGQVYQTGADAYELFLGWLLLIAGWVIISRFAALWLLWLILINTALIFYWEQVFVPNKGAYYYTLFMFLAAINTTGMAFFLYGLQKGIEWLKSTFYYRLIYASILLYLSVPSIGFIIGARRSSVIPLLVFVLFMAAGYVLFRVHFPDIVALTTWAFTGCIVLLFAIGRALFRDNLNAPSLFLLFGIIVIGVFGGSVMWLRMISNKMNENEQTGEKHDA